MASPRWALMRRYDIPDLLDTNDIYLTRWRLVQTPWFGIYLHCIRRPDNDRHLHDHPWAFATLVLRGGYQEAYHHTRASALRFADDEHAPGRHTWRAGSFHRMRRGAFHAITYLLRVPTWTLVFVGRRRPVWGYATSDGFVPSDEYHHDRNPDGFAAPPHWLTARAYRALGHPVPEDIDDDEPIVLRDIDRWRALSARRS